MKFFLAIIVLLILNCSRSKSQKAVGKLEIDTNLNDPFFKDSIYLTNPVSIDVFKNDSLESSEIYNNTSAKNKLSNALIEDKSRKTFGFRQCNANFIQDTLFVSFNSLPPMIEQLKIKIFKNRFIAEYIDEESGGKKDTWQVCSQKLILNSNEHWNKKTFGKLDIALSKNENCDSMIRFEGPFYFSY